MNTLNPFCFLPFHAFRNKSRTNTIRYIAFIPGGECIERPCSVYFSELYKKLSDACRKGKENTGNALSSSCFMDYYDYPGIIGERFKKLLDPQEKGIIDESMFVHTMTNLAIGSLYDKIKFIFQIIDFDNDGSISKEDIKTILLHIPMAEKSAKVGIRPTLSEPSLLHFHQNDDMFARIKAQDNISNFLKLYFKSDFISYEEFEICILKQAADIFINLMYILIQKQPTLTEVYMTEIIKATKSNTLVRVLQKETEFKISSFLLLTSPFAEINNASITHISSAQSTKVEEENIIDNEEIKINSLKSIKLNSNDIQSKNQINNRHFKTPKTSQCIKPLVKLRSRSFQRITLPETNQSSLYEKAIITRNVHPNPQSPIENSMVLWEKQLSPYFLNNNIIEGKLLERIGEEIVESYYILRNKILYSIIVNRN